MPLPTKKSEPIIDPGRLTILVYGGPGIGKSTFASRAEDVIFLATEPGLSAISAYKYDPSGQDRDDPLIESWEQLLTAYNELKSENHPFKTVVIDTLDNAYRLCVEHMCRTFHVIHASDIGGYGKGNGLINNEFYRVMKLFAGLPYGLFLCAHEREVRMKLRTGEVSKIAPDLPDTPRGKILGLVDFCLYAYAEELEVDGQKKKVHLMRTKPDQGFEAKDRFVSLLHLPEVMRLSYPSFIKMFREGLAKIEEGEKTATESGDKPKNPATSPVKPAMQGGRETNTANTPAAKDDEKIKIEEKAAAAAKALAESVTMSQAKAEAKPEAAVGGKTETKPETTTTAKTETKPTTKK